MAKTKKPKKIKQPTPKTRAEVERLIGDYAILDACLTEAVVVCARCGTLGASACTQKEAEDAWNARHEAPMSLAEFAAKHSRVISIIEECAGKQKAALIICLERKNNPMVGGHQYKIHGGDAELNNAVNDLLAYCLYWLDDTKGIKS